MKIFLFSVSAVPATLHPRVVLPVLTSLRLSTSPHYPVHESCTSVNISWVETIHVHVQDHRCMQPVWTRWWVHSLSVQPQSEHFTFVQSCWCSECCQMSITRLDAYLPIALKQVQCGKYCFSFNGSIHIIDSWQGIYIPFRNCVQSPIINAYAWYAVRFRREKCWCPYNCKT